MHVFLTFDYELFFGSNPGTVQKCMIEPTNKLLKIARKHGAPMTFFVDIGYLIRLKELSVEFPQLKNDLQVVERQLQEIQDTGSELQLHIHPHWEKAIYDGEKWIIDATNCYKLSDFKTSEAISIVRKYHAALQEYARQPIVAYRAGGWCVQPFEPLADVFKELNITIDSSVFAQGKMESEHYAFDFTSVAPFTDRYRFEKDVCMKDHNGYFTEIPIASWHYSPLFFWRLYVLGRVFRSQHKMMGDGNFIPQPNRKNTSLQQKTWNHVSSDGYFASKLKQQLKTYQSKGLTDFVVIGHPKGMTAFSLKKLEQFVAANQVSFTKFGDQ